MFQPYVGKVFRRCVAVAGLVLAVQVFESGPSWAATCGPGTTGYFYAGESNTSDTYEGLQGEIGLGGTQLKEHSVHLINYYDLSDPASDCNGAGSCWLQAGYGQGNVGGYTNPTADRGYFEANDENGYTVLWSPTADVTGATNSSYISLTYVGSAGGQYEYEADAYTSSGSYYLGQAWFNHEQTAPFVQSETYYQSDGVCSVFDGPFYYGANASGGYGSSSYIEASFNGSATFSVIANAGWATHGPSYQLSYTELNGNRYMFKVQN